MKPNKKHLGLLFLAASLLLAGYIFYDVKISDALVEECQITGHEEYVVSRANITIYHNYTYLNNITGQEEQRQDISVVERNYQSGIIEWNETHSCIKKKIKEAA